MTRRKSKMLALAVMGAILMGGYSGVNPVYAADTNAGALTGVTSINADDSNSKFSIDANGVISAVGGKFKVDENNIKLGYLTINATNDGIKFMDTNRSNADGSYVNVITISEMKTASDKTKGMRRYTENDRFDIPRDVTAIENQVKIRNDGRIEINTNGSNSEQSVVIDSGAGILVGHQDQVKKLLDQDSSVTAEQKNAYLNKTAGISYDGVFAGGIKFDEAKAGMSNVDGSLKAASGKFTVNADGAISAAGKKFEVTKDGELKLDNKLTIQQKNFGGDVTKSASLDIDSLGKLNQLVNYSSGDKTVITAGDGSTIGGVTFSNGQLSASYSGAPEGIARVNVSDLAADHDIITNDGQYTYSSTTVKSKIDSLEQSSETLGSQIQKIERITNVDTGKEGTSIAGNLDVYDDGTVIINDGKDAKVTIDSDRISIGNVSLIENDYVEKNGTIHYNDTINDYAKLDVKKGKIGYKVGNYSVTTSSATATDNYDVDQANKGTVFSNDTNYTRIDGAQINSVNGSNTGILDGASLELKSQFGNIKLINDQGTFTDANGNSTEIRGAQITTRIVNATEGVNAKTIRIGAHVGTPAELEFYVADDGNVYTKGMLSALDGKFLVYEDGALRAADGKFDVDKDGALKAANGEFSVDKDGKLITASGSKIGDVTINGESLSYGSKSIKVSDLASDHALVNDAQKGNEKLYNDLRYVKAAAYDAYDKTGGIRRDIDPDDSTKSATVIEEALTVENDGTATITNGFKAGADGKNSLTTTGLKTTEIRAGNNNTEFFVDGGGNVVADGTLNAVGGKFDVSSEGNITANGELSVAGNKFRVNEDGSINANNKFNIDADGALRAADDKFTADKNGNVRAIGSLSAADTKFFVGTDGSINVNQKFIVDADGTISSEGTLSVAGGKYSVAADGSLSAADGKFKVDANGLITAGSMKMDNIEAADTNKGVTVGGVVLKNKTISAADNKFTVDENGKLISASGSKIGEVTIDGESLSYGTNSIKVSDLASDHDLVHDADKGNESLYNKISQAQGNVQGLGTKIQGIERNSMGTTATTTIEGKLKVGSDGTVKINEGEDQQVIIDSNGIKVGKNSSRMNDSYGFATTKDLYIGANSADAPTAAGSKFYVKGSDGSFKAAGGKFTVDELGDVTASGLTAKKITVGKNSTIDPEFMIDEDGNLTSRGKLSVAGDKFSVDADGALSVANGAFLVDNMGSVTTLGSVSLTSGVNSTQLRAGGVTFTKNGIKTTLEDGKLSYGSSSITISDLVTLKGLTNGVDNKTEGISRDTTGTDTTTTIEGKLKVGSDGTVTINEGDAQQVIIDSNGIKVGKNSSRMNDSYGFATTKDLYIGADSADVPTAAGSKFYVKGDDGSIKAANGKFTVDADGALSAADGNFTVDKNGTLTTKKLITDEMVITGSGAVGGSTGGSIAFGGNGTIKSNIVDGTKETHFETKADGVSTEVKDGVNTTTSNVNASGSTSTVTDGTLSSERNQTASAITDTVGSNSVTTDANGTTFDNGTNTTNINGSQLTSTNGTGTGKLDGSHLTLTEGTNKTELSAGGATFTKNGTTTTIDGEKITVTDATGASKDIDFANLSKLDTTSQANTAAIEDLQQSKADVVGSNIDTSAWSDKLGTGVIEKDNKGLVNGGTVYDALDKKADTSYVDNMASGLNNRMEAMSYSLTRDMNRVGAGAAALAGLHPQSYDPDCKLDFAAGYGHYRNANAMAIGMYYRPNAGTMFSLAGTIGNGDPMVSAGVSFKIGYNSKVEKVIVKKEDYEALQEQVNQLAQVVQQLVAEKEAKNS